MFCTFQSRVCYLISLIYLRVVPVSSKIKISVGFRVGKNATVAHIFGQMSPVVVDLSVFDTFQCFRRNFFRHPNMASSVIWNPTSRFLISDCRFTHCWAQIILFIRNVWAFEWETALMSAIHYSICQFRWMCFFTCSCVWFALREWLW